MAIRNFFRKKQWQSEMPFNLAVTMGYIDGFSYVQKFGANPLIETGTVPEDIWEGGGSYPFSANGVADIVSISSSDAGDTQSILIYGLDASGDVVVQVVTLQGQTRVALATPLWRVYRMENFSFPGVSFAGTVYCYSGTTATSGVPSGGSVTKALIDDGNNQTQMAIYTIPAGKVGFLRRGEVGFGYSGSVGAGTQQVEFCFEARTYNNVFKIKKTVYCISTGDTQHVDHRAFPDPVPALSDIKTCVKNTTEDVKAHSTFHFWLVDEGLFSDTYLAGILQPGYV